METNTPQSDHDILIKLVETVKNNQSVVVDKIEEVKVKVKEVNDGINQKVTDHESRIKILEGYVTLTHPEQAMKDIAGLIQWRDHFEFTWRFIVGIAATIGGLVGFILSVVLGLLQIFGHR